jgi:hypothetical protein
MKRIVLLVCGLSLLVIADTAEARRNRQPSRTSYTYNYTQTTRPVTYTRPATTQQVTYTRPATQQVTYRPVTSTQPVTYTRPVQTSYAGHSTATAQGVANIMASTGRVGHWGGNTGYEGCGMGATPQAAYAICCYANSGMATVDVGYARGANGMWYCCRRYR